MDGSNVGRVGEERASNPLEGIEEIDWASIPNGYGDGVEVRHLLHQIVGLSAGPERDEALDDLWQCLLHQGSVSPATSHALPFVVKIAQTDEQLRGHLLGLVAACAHPFSRFTEEGRQLVDVGPGDPARVSVRHLLPQLAQIGDMDARSRPWVAACLGQFPESAGAHVERLRVWHHEAAEPARAALYDLALLCLGVRTPSSIRAVEGQQEHWGEDVDQDVLADLLAGRPQPDRHFARIGQLLWDAAILTR